MTGNPFHQANDSGWCQCSEKSDGCGRVFSSLAGFDEHFIREGTGNDWWLRCRSEEELIQAGFHRKRNGWWLLDREAESEVA